MFKIIQKIWRTVFSSALIWAFIVGFISLLFGFISFFIQGKYKWGLDFSLEGFGAGFRAFSDLLFNTVRLLFLESPEEEPENIYYKLAQIFSVGFITIGIASVLWEISRKFRDLFRTCWFLILRAANKRPAITIGLGRIGLPLAIEIRNEKNRPVYAMSVNDEPQNIKKAQRKGILVIEGDATDPDMLEKLPVSHDSEIFIATGDDARNIEIAGAILKDIPDKNVRNRNRSPIEGYVHVSNDNLRSTIRAQELLFDDHKAITFTPFSTPNTTARNLFNQLFLDQKLGIISQPDNESDLYTSFRKFIMSLLGRIFKPNNEPDFRNKQQDENPAIFNLPGKDEVFHLFIFGFNEIGQSIALHAARFAHFESCLRPRITIFEDAEKGTKPWKVFTDRYSAFSPRELNLSPEVFLNAGDHWESHCFAPNDDAYQTRKENQNGISEIDREQKPHENEKAYRERIKIEEAAQEFGILQNHAVEYAVNAEYKPILTDVESCTLLDKISARLCVKNPKVKSAFIFCFEDERRNFNDALRIQQELARNLFEEDKAKKRLKCMDKDLESLFPVPLFLHLPVEKGLVNLLRTERDSRNSERSCKLPILSFGEQEKISSYGIITNSEIRNYASGLKEVYKTLSGEQPTSHVDFDSSDMEAAMFAEVKLKTLGITFQKGENGSAGKEIFADYYKREVQGLYKEWKKKYTTEEDKYSDSTRLRLPYKMFKKMVYDDKNENSKEMRLLERLTLLQRIIVEKEPELSGDVLQEAKEEELKEIRRLKSKVVKKSIERYRSYFPISAENGNSTNLDLDAKMEHNRWMGERLSKNWKFGKRENHRRQRETFVPWQLVPKWDKDYKEELFSRYKKLDEWTVYEPDDSKDYDRQQLPRIILARREQGWRACININE